MMSLNREDYLLVIWEFLESFGSISEKEIAVRLKISTPTAYEYLQKLSDAGLIIKKRGDVTFTPEGRNEAVSLVRMHRISEVFAYRFLEIPWEDTHSAVMDLEHLFTGEKGNKLFKNLGYPAACPHGNPTDPLKSDPELAVAYAPEGDYTLKRVSFEEKSLLKTLSSYNCLPGTHLKLIKEGARIILSTASGEISIPEDLSLSIRLSRDR